MHFVSKGGTDGTDGGIEKWDDAFTCYGPGPKGIEHEGIRFGFGNMDKVVVCSKCGQAWGWRERLWKELMDWERSRTLNVDFSTTSKDTLVSNIKV